MLSSLRKDNFVNKSSITILWLLVLGIVFFEYYLVTVFWIYFVLLAGNYEACALHKIPIHNIIKPLLFGIMMANLIFGIVLWYTLSAQWATVLSSSLPILLCYYLFCVALSVSAMVWNQDTLNKLALAHLLAVIPLTYVIIGYHDYLFWRQVDIMLLLTFMTYLVFFLALCVFLRFNAHRIHSTVMANDRVISNILLPSLQTEFIIWGVLCLVIALFTFCFMSLLVTNSSFLLLIVLIVNANDIFGYCSGRLIGGRKLYPRISPNKTYAGSIFGAVISVVLVLIIKSTGADMSYLFFMTHATVWINTVSLIFYVLLMSLISQVGDLAMSFLKRRVHRKDTGVIMLSHGGLLDRLDSMLIAVIVGYLFL